LKFDIQITYAFAAMANTALPMVGKYFLNAA